MRKFTKNIVSYLILCLMLPANLLWAQMAPNDSEESIDSLFDGKTVQVTSPSPLATPSQLASPSQAAAPSQVTPPSVIPYPPAEAEQKATDSLEFDNLTIEKLSEQTAEQNITTNNVNLGLLEIEEQIALSNFESDQSLLNRAILLQVYEKIALALCFPSLNAILSKTDFKPDASCQQILAKIDSIHENNTFSVCAKNGIDAVACAQSFEEQSVRKANYNDNTNFKIINSGFDPTSDPLVAKRYEVLQKKLIEADKNFRSLKNISNLKSLETASFPVLALLCRNQMMELSLNDPRKKQLAPSQSLAGLADSIKDFESSINDREPKEILEDDKQDNKLNENKFFRVRILSESCFDTITDLLSVDPRLPSGICFKDSFIAPSCISALRRFRTLKDDKAENLPTPTPKDSLSSF